MYIYTYIYDFIFIACSLEIIMDPIRDCWEGRTERKRCKCKSVCYFSTMDSTTDLPSPSNRLLLINNSSPCNVFHGKPWLGVIASCCKSICCYCMSPSFKLGFLTSANQQNFVFKTYLPKKHLTHWRYTSEKAMWQSNTRCLCIFFPMDTLYTCSFYITIIWLTASSETTLGPKYFLDRKIQQFLRGSEFQGFDILINLPLSFTFMQL